VAGPAWNGAAKKYLAVGLFGRRRGAAGEPRQRNSLTQFEAVTFYNVTGPFGVPRRRVRIDSGQIASHHGDVSFLCFSVYCPKG
jgi:hypothetical protein